MEIPEIKEKMKSYVDFFGGNFIGRDEIDSCKTRQELAEIFNQHHAFLESQCNDAQHSMERFQQTLGLYNID